MLILMMNTLNAKRQTLTPSVFFAAVLLCVSFVNQAECQTPAPTRKLFFSSKARNVLSVTLNTGK